MDKEFIKSNNFTEDVERFKQIAEYKTPKQSLKKLYEYTFITSPQINEEGEDENGNQQDMPTGNPQQQNPEQNMGMNGGMQQPMDGGMQQPMGGNMQPPMDDGMQQPMGNMPMDGGMQQPMGNMQQPMDGNMQQPMDANMPMDGGMQQPMDGGMPMDDGSIDTQEMEEDEVIDVDDLTQSQEATEYKIDGVDDRLAKIYAVVQKFSDQLEKNEKSIMALKDEFEKRNPTEEEKLNIRSQSSYPYSETPRDYWDNKAKENPHYNIMYDNEVSPSEEQKNFEIKRSDISDLNMKDISDTLDIDQNLKNYLNF